MKINELPVIGGMSTVVLSKNTIMLPDDDGDFILRMHDFMSEESDHGYYFSVDNFNKERLETALIDCEWGTLFHGELSKVVGLCSISQYDFRISVDSTIEVFLDEVYILKEEDGKYVSK